MCIALLARPFWLLLFPLRAVTQQPWLAGSSSSCTLTWSDSSWWRGWQTTRTGRGCCRIITCYSHGCLQDTQEWREGFDFPKQPCQNCGEQGESQGGKAGRGTKTGGLGLYPAQEKPQCFSSDSGSLCRIVVLKHWGFEAACRKIQEATLTWQSMCVVLVGKVYEAKISKCNRFFSFD